MNWNKRFEIAKKYYEHNGHLRVKGNLKTSDGITYDENGLLLGHWINAQRASYRLGELTDEHRRKLESIGMIFENVNDLDWNNFYNQACIYLEHYHSLVIPTDFKTKNGYERDESGKNLGAWFKIQQMNYNKGSLSQERSKKIEELYITLKHYKDLDWLEMYELAKKYYEKYNILIVKEKNILIDSDGKKINLSDLSKWIKKQRRDYKDGKLSKERIKMLEQIGMIFENVSQVEWERMYKLANIYLYNHGNIKVPRNFKTKDGITYDKNGSPLGKWLNAQYSNNISGSLSLEHKERLEAIGMIFTNQSEAHWNKMLKLATIYLEHHGNLKIPLSFKTSDGYTYDENGEALGEWISRQRSNSRKKSLTKIHQQKLESIGVEFESFYELEWERMYKLAKKYYDKFKNLNVDASFKTNDGITYDENGDALGAWIYRQWYYFKLNSISKERMKKLKKIGMTCDGIQGVNWEKMYKLAKKYYDYYHHLKVRSDFKTEDGIKFCESGENLYTWIAYQRQKYKNGELSEERIKKLESIGMIFETKKDKEQNILACKSYDIDYKKYKKQIDTIPHKEFMAKINYLNNNGIPFESEGILHPIFFMSSINMEVRYGVSLEQMINDYFMSSEKIKLMQISK